MHKGILKLAQRLTTNNHMTGKNRLIYTPYYTFYVEWNGYFMHRYILRMTFYIENKLSFFKVIRIRKRWIKIKFADHKIYRQHFIPFVTIIYRGVCLLKSERDYHNKKKNLNFQRMSGEWQILLILYFKIYRYYGKVAFQNFPTTLKYLPLIQQKQKYHNKIDIFKGNVELIFNK